MCCRGRSCDCLYRRSCLWAISTTPRCWRNRSRRRRRRRRRQRREQRQETAGTVRRIDVGTVCTIAIAIATAVRSASCGDADFPSSNWVGRRHQHRTPDDDDSMMQMESGFDCYCDCDCIAVNGQLLYFCPYPHMCLYLHPPLIPLQMNRERRRRSEALYLPASTRRWRYGADSATSPAGHSNQNQYTYQY